MNKVKSKMSQFVQGSHERYEVALAKTLEDLAVVEQAYEDASAREVVFDETVANLVRAKMEHAQADATMRQMRDEMESLNAATSPGGSTAGAASTASTGPVVQRCDLKPGTTGISPMVVLLCKD
jgi:hypothetical protein